MTAVDPTSPAPVVSGNTAAGAGSTDADDLAQMLADEQDIEVRRLSIINRHGLDVTGPVMQALSRIAGLDEALTIEIRLIRNYLGGA